MSLLREANGLTPVGEDLKHEGVMDMFKSKNIKTTERTLILIDSLNILQSYDDKNWCYEADYFLENSETLKTNFDTFLNVNKNKILEYNKYLNNFLNSGKKIIILNKNSSYKFKNLSFKSVFSELKKGLNSETKFNSIFNIVIKNNNNILKVKKDNKDLLLQQDLFKKVIDIINKENEFTTDDITKETAINQDWFDTQTAIAEFLVTAESLTSESASNFVSNIKTFFSNSIMGISNAISNFMKSYTVTDKYFKDNVKELNNRNSIINSIMSKKFYDIENIETKCVVGMKLNYVGTTKELKVFSTKIPEIKSSIDKMSSFVENIYNNHNDARLSNISNLGNISELRTKTTSIINELIDGKSIKEDVTIGNLFPNINGIKSVKEDLLEVNNTLSKADIDGLNKSVSRLTNILTIFLKEINDDETVYSKRVIEDLQYGVKEVADVITNFGTFLVLSNQFTSYYITTLDVINDAKNSK